MAKNGNVETMASIMVPEGRDSPFERVLWMPMNARTHTLSPIFPSPFVRHTVWLFVQNIFSFHQYCVLYALLLLLLLLLSNETGNERFNSWLVGCKCTWSSEWTLHNLTTSEKHHQQHHFCFVSNGNVFASSSCAAIHFQMNLWRRCCCASHVLHFLIAHSFRPTIFLLRRISNQQRDSLQRT